LLLIALLALGALAACSSSDGGEADVAKQDRKIEQANQAASRYAAGIKAALRQKWRARARARARARLERAHARRQRAVVRSSPRTTGDICAPIRRRFPGRAGRAERRARRLRRRQVLYYLNLSCGKT
jgi:hypothetical protein